MSRIESPAHLRDETRSALFGVLESSRAALELRLAFRRSSQGDGAHAELFADVGDRHSPETRL